MEIKTVITQMKAEVGKTKADSNLLTISEVIRNRELKILLKYRMWYHWFSRYESAIVRWDGKE